MKKFIILLIVIVILSGYGYYGLLKENGFTGFVIKSETVHESNAPPQVYFTKEQNITPIILGLFEESKDIKCAFYDLDDQSIIDALKDKNAIVTIEDKNALEDFQSGLSSASMHNKFCILDNFTVITGSMNPTARGIYKNDNNVIVIYSEYIAENYLDEFEELINRQFGEGRRVKYQNIVLNNKTEIKNIFCPEDDCQKAVLEELENANSSIKFMTFSFTDQKIADKLIEKKKSGVDVKGVFEKSRLNMNYEKYKFLNESGIQIYPDKNKANMHHKVFIIDGETVVTGSYNPTMSGNERNDENMVIIKDKDIAEQYLEEFSRLIK